jgi:pantothenate kinase
MPDSIAALASDAVSELHHSKRPRYLIGITGQPGAGKSTLVEALVKACSTELGPQRVVGLPMDGFHLTNQQLSGIGLRDLKGAPTTFDAHKFAAALEQLVTPTATVTWPAYSRVLHEPIPDAIAVPPSVQLIFVDGNYLLLQSSPWDAIRALLDSVWYVGADLETIKERLLKRQLDAGRSLADAEAHVLGSDMENARQIAATESFADRVVEITQADPMLKGLKDPATGRWILPDQD